MLRSVNVLETVGELTTGDASKRLCLHELRDALGLRNIAYFGLPAFGSLQTPPHLAVTYDDAWVAHYKTRRYAETDPVLRRGLTARSRFDWSELDRSSPDGRRFFGEAGEFDIGRNGVTVPIMGRGAPIALISFTADVSDAEWRRSVAEVAKTLQVVGFAMHERIWSEVPQDRDDNGLTDREIECLKWSAVGKTAFESSVILGISERTVRHHLERSRRKLDATNITHAVVKAINGNLLGHRL